MWLPKGTAIVEELEKLAKETEFQAGYVRVKTPHIAKEKMYLTSGHLPILYKESMFPPMRLDPENVDSLLKQQATLDKENTNLQENNYCTCRRCRNKKLHQANASNC